MKLKKYHFVHPESPWGRLYANLDRGTSGDGLPDYSLVAVTPSGLYVLKRRNWLERLFNL